MTYLTNLKRGLRSFYLDQKAMKELATDKDATKHGVMTLAIAGVILGVMMTLAGVIFTALYGPLYAEEMELLSLSDGIVVVFMLPFLILATFVISYSLLHLFAKLLGGKGSGTQFFRVASNTMVIYWAVAPLLVVPVIGGLFDRLLSLWLVVVLVVIAKTLHKFSTGRAIVAMVVLPVLVLLAVIFVVIFAGAYLGIFSP